GPGHRRAPVAGAGQRHAHEWPGRATDAPACQPGPCGTGSGDPGAAVSGGRGMRIAANLSLLFTEYPLIDRPRAACAAGFDAVESQFPYEVPAVRLKEELERLQLPLVLISLPSGDLMQGGDGLACVPARQAEFDQALEAALSYAAMVRPQAVNVLAG